MALAGPRREHEQQPCAAEGGHRVPLVRIEAEEPAGPGVDEVAARLDPRLALDDENKSGLPDLVLAELVAGSERDEDDASFAVARVEHGRRVSIHVVEVPMLHERGLPEHAPRYTRPVPPAVDTFPLGPYQANCYVVRAERGAAEAAVVDPGADPSQLRLELAGTGARCAGILVTHTDVDHIGAVADLAEATGAEVWAPAGEVEAMRAGVTRGGMRVPPHDPAHVVTGGDSVEVAGLSFEVVDVPGHSSGHVAFHADGALFSGDLLFAGSVGRVDLPGGDWDTLLASVRTLLERYPPDTIVYPGHGPRTTLGAELARNPYLAELRT